MMGVNPPTAYLLLADIVKLPRGSWVIQNGANSGVGRATIAIAKSLGLRTVNVVRREEVIAEMKALGGDVVLVDGPGLGKRVATETGSAPITLAVDGVGDTSPMNLMNCLSESGVLVCYGGDAKRHKEAGPGARVSHARQSLVARDSIIFPVVRGGMVASTEGSVRRQDSNLGMAESKSATLPLGYAPKRAPQEACSCWLPSSASDAA
jgi:NADPH:quinone reductase-like Zn-dependent oxidoreductase